MGMRPGNISLVEALLEHLFERHFVTAHMMHVTLPDLDLKQPLVLRAGGF